MTGAIHDRPCALYRLRGERGRLLYVGISYTAMKRIEDHARQQDWFTDVRRIDLEWFPSRFQAEDAEVRAIKTERPKHNVVHAPVAKRSPSAERSIAALAERGVDLEEMRRVIDSFPTLEEMAQ